MTEYEKEKLKYDIKVIQTQFEMEVEAICLEVTHLAKDVSKAIGEISIDEAKSFIAKEFADRLINRKFFHGEFKGKRK